MRISDWSSDVCSSDLAARRADAVDRGPERDRRGAAAAGAAGPADPDAGGGTAAAREKALPADAAGARRVGDHAARGRRAAAHVDRRSEEHKSELQSLMRHSYDVFCLKKKNDHYDHV